MGNISAKYGYKADVETISRSIENISKSLDDISSPEVLKKCFGLMDLTSLHTDDTDEKIKKLVERSTPSGMPILLIRFLPPSASTLASPGSSRRRGLSLSWTSPAWQAASRPLRVIST